MVHDEVFLAQGILEVLRGDFPEEAAGCVGLVLAVAGTRLGEGEADGLLRAGQGHIEEPALLFEFRFRQVPAAGGKEVFFHAGDENIGKFQALGGMDRHQGHLVGGFVLGDVHAGQEGDVLQKIRKGDQRELRLGHRRRVVVLPVFHQFVAEVAPDFLHIAHHAVQQFLHVGGPGLALDGIVRLVEQEQAGIGSQGLRRLMGIGAVQHGRRLLDEGAESADLRDSRPPKAEGFQPFQEGSPEQRGPIGLGRCREGVHRGVPDAASRLVDHPLEGFVVVQVRCELEIGHHILDFRPLEERISGIDDIGDIPFPELFFQGAGLRIGPVQDGEILVFGMDGVHPLQDGRGDQGRLLLLGEGPHEADLLAGLPHGHTLLGQPVLVPGDHGIGGIDDILRGPVVPLQAECLRFGEILPEVQDVLDLRPPEGIDGLGIVTHHAEVPVPRRQLLENQVLRHIGVLILVHHDGVEPAGDGRQGIGIPPQEDVHVQQDVVEVHHAGLAAQLAIGLVDPVEFGLLVNPVIVPVSPGAVGVGSRGHEVVLGLGNAGKHLLGLVGLIVQAQLLDAGLDRTDGIGRIINGETRGEADGVGELPQETDEDRMEGAHIDAPGLPVPHHLADAFLHLAGRLLGKGQGQDPGGIRPLFDHVCNPGSQYAGLPGTRPRHDQYRPFQTLDRLPLFLVQILKYRAHIFLNNLHENSKKKRKFAQFYANTQKL